MAAFDRRSFAGGAISTTVSPGIDGSTLTIAIADATGWPTGSAGNFFAVIDEGEASEEKVEIASRSGTTLTVAASGRGVDGTSAVSHSDGASIFHCLTARDLDEANEHVSDSRATAHAAGKISYTAGGDLEATNVNDAIDELEDEIAGVGGRLLASTIYNATTTPETSSSTFADADATNLKVDFTVPASGAVLVRLEGPAQLGNSATKYEWGLREGTTDLDNPCAVLKDVSGADSTLTTRVSATFIVTGLTPDDAKTYKWSHASLGGGSGMPIGDVIGQAGPAIMEVWAAPA